MFTGLIEKLGTIVKRQVSGGAGKLVVTPETPFDKLEYGESIAVNGACLTLEKELSDGGIVFHVLEETLSRTNLGGLPVGAKVNLERALAFGDRLGGHLMTGHVDAVAPIHEISRNGADIELAVSTPDSLQPYLVEKGSVGIDGISLTVVKVTKDFFTVHLIPTTMKKTNLHERKAGDPVNLEGDLLGKYVQRQLGLANFSGSNIDMKTLSKAGW